jgi:transcriptional regulator with XRE-family HTH domain
MGEERDHQLSLGAAIKAERERRNLSAETVAARAGVKEPWLLRIEAGRGNPTWGHLRRLADAMEVPLPELMKRIEDYEEEDDPSEPLASRGGKSAEGGNGNDGAGLCEAERIALKRLWPRLSAIRSALRPSPS